MGKAPNTPSSCIVCAGAKRRCGKQRPCCMRCLSRGIECQYPPKKPSNFIPYTDENVFPLQNPVPDSNCLQLSVLSDPNAENSEIARPSLEDDLSRLSHGQQRMSWWFTSPETWTIYHVPKEVRINPHPPVEIKHAVAKVHRWLAQWVDGNSNPFIHHQLYHRRFPQCIQDAYMTLSCYLHRKPSNEQTISQIIRVKACQLVERDNLLVDSSSESTTMLDPLEHLARSQALLVYQLIGLYDGDIRLRYTSESHISVLNRWMRQAVDHASQFISLGHSLGHFLVSASHEQVDADGVPWEKLVWYSWIFAESLRRTWLVVSAVHGVYLASQNGVVRCQGSMMFTSRKGFWSAPSALDWQKQCFEVYGGLVRLSETDKLLSIISPEELDDFAKLILEITFGIEQMERWGVECEKPHSIDF